MAVLNLETGRVAIIDPQSLGSILDLLSNLGSVDGGLMSSGLNLPRMNIVSFLRIKMIKTGVNECGLILDESNTIHILEHLHRIHNRYFAVIMMEVIIWAVAIPSPGMEVISIW